MTTLTAPAAGERNGRRSAGDYTVSLIRSDADAHATFRHVAETRGGKCVSATMSDMQSRRIRRGCARVLVTAVTVCALWLLPAAHGNAGARDIVLVLDNSGSMRKNDPQFLARIAVRTFLEGLEGDNHVALVLFDQNVRLLMPLTALNAATRSDFLASLDALNYRGLLTNTPAGLERALYELRVSGRAGGERIVVLMTDGIVDVAPEGPDAGDVEKTRWLKSTLADEAANSKVRIFGVAFTDDADFELIQTLANRTGGQYYRALHASDIDGVFKNVRSLLADTGASAPVVPPPAPATPGPVDAPRPDPPLPPVTGTAPAPVLASPSLPDATPPRTPDTAAPSLPGSGTRLPEVSLPESDLPKVNLPEIRLPGDKPAADPSPAGSTSPATPGKAASDAPTTGGPATGSTTGATPGESPALPDTRPALPDARTASSAAKPDDDVSLLLALAAGGAALLLALAALAIVLLRRRVRPVATTDPLMPKAFLNDIGGVTAHKSYEVGAKPIIVGRLRGPDTDAACYVVIDESTVGRRHALLQYKEHSFWVSDQNSLNGTFVNNTRVDAPTRLKHGDRIRFHKHEFEFLVLDMFETDRTMMSETVFAKMASEPGEDDSTVVREGAVANPSPEDPTVTRR